MVAIKGDDKQVLNIQGIRDVMSPLLDRNIT